MDVKVWGEWEGPALSHLMTCLPIQTPVHLLGCLEQLIQSAGIGSAGKVPQHEGNHLHEPAGRGEEGGTLSTVQCACVEGRGGHEGAC